MGVERLLTKTLALLRMEIYVDMGEVSAGIEEPAESRRDQPGKQGAPLRISYYSAACLPLFHQTQVHFE